MLVRTVLGGNGHQVVLHAKHERAPGMHTAFLECQPFETFGLRTTTLNYMVLLDIKLYIIIEKRKLGEGYLSSFVTTLNLYINPTSV